MPEKNALSSFSPTGKKETNMRVSYLKSAISFSSEVKAVGRSHPIEIFFLLHCSTGSARRVGTCREGGVEPL